MCVSKLQLAQRHHFYAGAREDGGGDDADIGGADADIGDNDGDPLGVVPVVWQPFRTAHS